jgi:predicted HTH domain antitoxin
MALRLSSGAIMQVAINLPSDFVEMQTVTVIEREMRISYALALFKAARVTLSKAAELAGMNIYDCMKACRENRIPVIDITREELLQEMDAMGPA